MQTSSQDVAIAQHQIPDHLKRGRKRAPGLAALRLKIGNIVLTGVDTAVFLSLSLRISPPAARAMKVGLACHSHDTA